MRMVVTSVKTNVIIAAIINVILPGKSFLYFIREQRSQNEGAVVSGFVYSSIA